MSRFYKTSGSNPIDWAYQLPYQEMLQGLMSKQGAQDRMIAATGQIESLGQKLRFLNADRTEAMRQMEWLDSNVQQFTGMDLTDPTNRAKLRGFAREAARRWGPSGIAGKISSNFASFQAYQDALSKDSNISQFRRRRAIEKSLKDYKGVGSSDPYGGEYKSFSGFTPTKDFAYQDEWLKIASKVKGDKITKKWAESNGMYIDNWEEMKTMNTEQKMAAMFQAFQNRPDVRNAIQEDVYLGVMEKDSVPQFLTQLYQSGMSTQALDSETGFSRRADSWKIAQWKRKQEQANIYDPYTLSQVDAVAAAGRGEGIDISTDKPGTWTGGGKVAATDLILTGRTIPIDYTKFKNLSPAAKQVLKLQWENKDILESNPNSKESLMIKEQIADLTSKFEADDTIYLKRAGRKLNKMFTQLQAIQLDHAGTVEAEALRDLIARPGEKGYDMYVTGSFRTGKTKIDNIKTLQRDFKEYTGTNVISKNEDGTYSILGGIRHTPGHVAQGAVNTGRGVKMTQDHIDNYTNTSEAMLILDEDALEQKQYMDKYYSNPAGDAFILPDQEGEGVRFGLAGEKSIQEDSDAWDRKAAWERMIQSEVDLPAEQRKNFNQATIDVYNEANRLANYIDYELTDWFSGPLDREVKAKAKAERISNNPVNPGGLTWGFQ